MKRSVLSMLFLLFILFMFISSETVLAAPYYQGKVMKMVVGFSPGGGYDRMTRLLAKYLPKYIPGKPTIIVENMGGRAASLPPITFITYPSQTV